MMTENLRLDFEPHKLVRKHDPMTSRHAAHEAGEVRARHRGIILDALRRIGAMTSQEIADATGLEHWAVTRRMGELRDAMFVIQTQDRRRNRSGRQAIVWRAASP